MRNDTTSSDADQSINNFLNNKSDPTSFKIHLLRGFDMTLIKSQTYQNFNPKRSLKMSMLVYFTLYSLKRIGS